MKTHACCLHCSPALIDAFFVLVMSCTGTVTKDALHPGLERFPYIVSLQPYTPGHQRQNTPPHKQNIYNPSRLGMTQLHGPEGGDQGARPRQAAPLELLPAEIRSIIYQHTMGDVLFLKEMAIQLTMSHEKELWLPRLVGISDPGTRYGWDDGQKSFAQYGTARRLVQTCSLLRKEVTPMLWSKILVTLYQLEELTHLESMLTPLAKSMIRRLQVRIPGYKPQPGLKERRQFCRDLQAIPTLQELSIEDLDTSADSQEKGSIWKPHSLRIIMDVKKTHPQLLYSCYFLRFGKPSRTTVQLTRTRLRQWTEFHVEQEYEKWLKAIRQQRLVNELA